MGKTRAAESNRGANYKDLGRKVRFICDTVSQKLETPDYNNKV